MTSEVDLTGRTLGHYRIVEKIGAGGMGVVYRAEDTHLDRSVAIKVLSADAVADPEPKRRFAQEARSASALNHANIIHIYDIDTAEGTDFIAMEFVRGQTLDHVIGRDGLDTRQAVTCAVQIADALAAAHSAGIVHRDLKPANIMLTDKGVVKVLDFGLAKLMDQSQDGAFSTTRAASPVTEHGMIVGTVAYMSPEQAEGKAVDARSDIFSFGAVLYEMVTGRRAFAGDSTVGTLAAILHQEPAPSERIPPELETIIGRCLRKDPTRRSQHMGDVAVALQDLADAKNTPVSPMPAAPPSQDRALPPRRTRRRWWAAAATLCTVFAAALVLRGTPALRSRLTGASEFAPIRSIAVLPLENLSGNTEQEYFVDGMTDAITTELGKVSGFDKVSAWQSMKIYKQTTKPLGEIAREVDVDALVQGVVLREGNRVRISPKLFRVSPEKQLWANSYDRELREVLSLQSEVAQAIAREVGVLLTGRRAGPAGAIASVNPEAYDYYLKGNRYLDQRMDEASERLAVLEYERAVALDATFYQAYAKLAYAHSLLRLNYYDRTESRREAAREAAGKALRIQPQSADAHLAMGYVYYFGDGDFARALEEFDAAQKFNPNDSQVESVIAAVKRRQGKFEEAVPHYERATQLSPNEAQDFFNLGATYGMLRRYQDAERPFQRALSLKPQGQYYARKAWFALLEGRPDVARATLAEARDKAFSWPPIPFYWFRLEMYSGNHAAALSGLSSESLRAFDHQFYFVPKALLQAEAQAAMGQSDLARRSYDAARAMLEEKLRAQPDDDRYYASLGVAYAGLGRKKEAVEAGRKAVELYPLSRDAWRAAFRREDMARIYVMVGEPEEAIKQLDSILSVPAEISTYALLTDPTWAPLKTSAGFQELVRKYGR
jgi:serine/threonine protein kinase/Flp pilus assembly protein TadD